MLVLIIFAGSFEEKEVIASFGEWRVIVVGDFMLIKCGSIFSDFMLY